MILNKFFIPTRIEYGIGLSQKTGELLKAFNPKKVLIVTDPGVKRAGILTGIEQSLSTSDLAYEIYDQVEPNPSDDTIMKGTAFLKEVQADVVLAVGGGSSIDTAKGIAAMATNAGHILDYEGVDKLQNLPLPLIAIPTTAGTGSECTASTVVTNTQTKFKAAVLSPSLYPKLAILDAGLTLNLPQEITAATGMDALTHAIESYTSKNATPFSEALALQAMRMISEHLATSYFVGTDLHSREQMLVASALAGMAFAQSRLGNVHAISHTFGGVFNIAHGIANATLLPFVMKFNLPACPEKMRDIAIALGKDVSGLSVTQAAEKALEWVQEMNSALNIPGNIKELGVSLDKLPQLVEDSLRSGNVLVNPRLTRASEIKKIIENAYHGIMEF